MIFHYSTTNSRWKFLMIFFISSTDDLSWSLKSKCWLFAARKRATEPKSILSSIKLLLMGTLRIERNGEEFQQSSFNFHTISRDIKSMHETQCSYDFSPQFARLENCTYISYHFSIVHNFNLLGIFLVYHLHVLWRYSDVITLSMPMSAYAVEQESIPWG